MVQPCKTRQGSKQGYEFKGWENLPETMTMPGRDLVVLVISSLCCFPFRSNTRSSTNWSWSEDFPSL